MPPAMSKKKRKDILKGGGESFEFCEVCNLNHEQGRRHRFFPAHRRALAGVLYRFQKKISDLRFFVRNPSLLRPEHADLNSVWCVFCAIDIRENGGSFVCGKAIRHMASEEHMRNLKGFLWKNDGGTDRVDSFRVTEADLLKWEKGCEALKSAASTPNEGPIGPVLLPSKDIQFQYETNFNKMDSFQNHSNSYISSNDSEPVLPLQSFTNEKYSKCNTSGYGSTAVSHVARGHFPLLVGMKGDVFQHHVGGMERASTHLTDAHLNHLEIKGKRALLGNMLDDMGNDCRLSNRGSKANVHTGGLPPWLDMSDDHEKKLINFGVHTDDPAPPSAQKGKIRKLNPKRVGAAWADKRRIELEKEKKGEIIAGDVDANWLPNFGRVWQAGTRKASRKEFEKEKDKFLKADIHLESFKLQPYISKRMCREQALPAKMKQLIHVKSCSDMSKN